ncbi:MAG: TRAP transporter small permease [Polaromonas sp.]
MKNTIPNAAIGSTPSVTKPLLPPGPPAPAPIRYLGWLVDWSVLLIGATMATLIFVNVIVHNLFNGDVAWTTEFCELLMVWATFLGGAAATRRGAHMVVNELINHLHVTARRVADVCIQIVVLITLGLLFWYGLGIAEAGQMSTLTVLGWPMSSQYIALPVASLITMVFVGWDLTEILRGKSAEQRYGASQP